MGVSFVGKKKFFADKRNFWPWFFRWKAMVDISVFHSRAIENLPFRSCHVSWMSKSYSEVVKYGSAGAAASRNRRRRCLAQEVDRQKWNFIILNIDMWNSEWIRSSVEEDISFWTKAEETCSACSADRRMTIHAPSTPARTQVAAQAASQELLR